MRLAPLALALLLLPVSAPAAGSDWQGYGAELSKGRYRPVEGVVKKAQRWDGQRVRVEGEVVAVCRKKGCWMQLQAGEDLVRVSFKDYAFFVPKDCDGSTARVEGVFAIREVPVDEARHYLEDAGRHEEAMAITEPVRNFELVADGVALRRPD
jgi:hypothetical protein